MNHEISKQNLLTALLLGWITLEEYFKKMKELEGDNEKTN